MQFISCLKDAVPENINSLKDKSNIFNLITNCVIQCGLDGANGTLTIDSYPTNAGINTILQEQDIG